VRENVPFVLDTNEFVAIAREGKRELFEKLLGENKFFFTPKNKDEVYGLIKYKSNEIGPQAAQLLSEYLERLKEKLPNTSSDEYKERERMYLEKANMLVVLLPRKVVHTVLVTDEDSFANTALKTFEMVVARLAKGEGLTQIAADIAKMGELDLKGLDKRLEVRYRALFKAYKIELSKEAHERYRESIDKSKNDTIAKIKEVRERNKKMLLDYLKGKSKDIKVMIDEIKVVRAELMELGKKDYVGDVKIIAEARAIGAIINSLDDDVITLNDLLGPRA
jgi:gas vesicle protein